MVNSSLDPQNEPANSAALSAHKKFQELEGLRGRLQQIIDNSGLPADKIDEIKRMLDSALSGTPAAFTGTSLEGALKAQIKEKIAEAEKEEEHTIKKSQIAYDTVLFGRGALARISLFSQNITDMNRGQWFTNFISMTQPGISEESAATLGQIIAESDYGKQFAEFINQQPVEVRESIAKAIEKTTGCIEEAAKDPTHKNHAILKSLTSQKYLRFSVMPEFQSLVEKLYNGEQIDKKSFDAQLKGFELAYDACYDVNSTKEFLETIGKREGMDAFSEAAKRMLDKKGQKQIIDSYFKMLGDKQAAKKATEDFNRVFSDPSEFAKLKKHQQEAVILFALGAGSSEVAAKAMVTETLRKIESLSRLPESELDKIAAAKTGDHLYTKYSGYIYLIENQRNAIAAYRDAGNDKRLEIIAKVASEKNELSGVAFDPTKISGALKSTSQLLSDKDLLNLSGDKAAFDKQAAHYLDAFINSMLPQSAKIQKETIRAVAQTEVIHDALENRKKFIDKYGVEFESKLYADKDAFMKQVDKLIQVEQAAFDAAPKGQKQGAQPYTAVLREIRAFDVSAPPAVDLIKEIIAGKISGDEAYAKWQKIKDEYYDINIDATKQSLKQQLGASYPELVARLNRIDFEKEIEPLIVQLREDPKLMDRIRDLNEQYMNGKISWKQLDADQNLVIALLSEGPMHMGTNSICMYGKNAACSAIQKEKDGIEKDGISFNPAPLSSFGGYTQKPKLTTPPVTEQTPQPVEIKKEETRDFLPKPEVHAKPPATVESNPPLAIGLPTWDFKLPTDVKLPTNMNLAVASAAPENLGNMPLQSANQVPQKLPSQGVGSVT